MQGERLEQGEQVSEQRRFHRPWVLALLLLFAVGLAQEARAAVTVTPVTWNVIGLDSNNPLVGPDTFQVGVRACNTGAAITNLTGTFVWDSSNTYINLSGASANNLGTLAAGACTDLYFSVVVTRTSAAYNTTRRYHITVTGDGITAVSTPTPRELFVERLISQGRNAVNSVTGPSTVYVGQTYSYTVNASTATQGYEQLEAFLNLSNVVFQVLSISTTYSNPAGATNDKFYADACGWENNPLSANYRSCVGPVTYAGGKAGGTVSTTYTVRILSSGSTTATTLVLDFSGSSYHYNSDFGVTILSVTALPPPLTLSKTASGTTVTTGSNVTYTLRVVNTAAVSFTLTDFVDTPPTSPASPAYVAGSSAYNGTAITDPTTAGATRTWTGSFLVPAGATRDLTYRMTMPNTTGTYTNTAIAHINNLQIDTTPSNTDNAPATASVVVVLPPHVTLCKTISGQSCPPPASLPAQQPGTDVTYVITFTSDGGTAAQNLNLIDIVPFSVVNSAIVRTTNFKLGSLTFTPGTSGLTLGGYRYYSDPISYPAPTAPWTPATSYTPTGAAGTYDPNVTYVGWQLNGSMLPGTTGTISFTVRIR